MHCCSTQSELHPRLGKCGYMLQVTSFIMQDNGKASSSWKNDHDSVSISATCMKCHLSKGTCYIFIAVACLPYRFLAFFKNYGRGITSNETISYIVYFADVLVSYVRLNSLKNVCEGDYKVFLDNINVMICKISACSTHK